ncbi:M15 family metallopeptidase [Aquimarina gracilis]|uniref:M15 family metallopeptidase n=1 Tax=Aquimarina gracilis TaxID=874422 RepID=A0ABU5ZWU5_9FLAO|nr:M15 family metallopeptidase [Aquimarina gracilis]MEB3346312.1 M15 family metallopeptidase [Aquimarina gracilis]
MKVKTKIIIGTGIAFAGILFLMRNKIASAVWDLVSENRIKKLHPAIQNKVRTFINRAEKEGIQLRVTDGLRTFQEQDDLYAQGRTKPGKIVTNAKAGQSYHNYGLAVDVVPMVNGRPNYKDDYQKMARIGKSLGFTWGGDFKNLSDKPHFHMTFGNSIAELQNKVLKKQVQNGYVIV